MSMSDPIADFLTRIRNAVMARHDTLEVPASNLKAELAALLKQEGYVKNFKIIREGVQGSIRVTLKYDSDRRPAIQGLKRVSRPGLRVYRKANDLPVVLNGLGSVIISTSSGIMTDKEAREANVGGEILCYVW